jgi:broad specificity phosphatase PhoE
MEILLVRHGEMAYEKSDGIDLDLVHAYANGVKQGPLSDRGNREAQQVASLLVNGQVDALYASEFQRARETANATAEALSRDVEIVADLGELRPGYFDPARYPSQRRFLKALGLAHKTLPRAVGDKRAGAMIGYALIVFFLSNWYRGRTERGESRSEALGRARGALELFESGHEAGERVAVFTHGYFIHLLVNQVVDPKGAARRLVRTPYIKNGSITTLSYDATSGWSVKEYAATRHL